MIRRRFGAWVGILLLAGTVPAVGGTIYVWRDSAGISHYTTDPEAVPVEYREAAIPVVPEHPGEASLGVDGPDGDATEAWLQPEPLDPAETSVENPTSSEREPASLLERQRRARRSAWEGN